MRWNWTGWPLPRRDPDEPSQPVELLLDITFVLALQQAGNLLESTSVIRAIAALTVVVTFWQTSAVAVTIASVTAAPTKLLTLIQTALFLMLAVTLPEAFGDHTDRLSGQIVFGTTVTLSVATSMFLWICVVKGHPRYYRNAAMIIFAYTLYGSTVWWSLHLQGTAQAIWLLVSYGVSVAVGFSTVLPLYDRFGIGITEGWWCQGVRAFAERFTACYVVSCCMVLELLELVAQSMAISPALLVCTLESLLIAYFMYWIYDPLVAPAQRQHDPRNPLVSSGRRSALHFNYLSSHMLMCSGLVVTAGALREILTTVVGSDTGPLGPPIETSLLVELYAGIVVCLLGQSIFFFFTVWKVDPLRLSGCVALLAVLPLLIDRPALLAVTVLLSGCAVLLYLNRVRARLTPLPPPVFPFSRLRRGPGYQSGR